MSQFTEEVYQIKGIDRATPADESAPGSCLAIENLVPVGPPEDPYWSVATAAAQKGSSTGILSLGRQTRSRIGPLADAGSYPNVQSADRLVALKEDGVYVIDPSNSYAEAQLYTFPSADSTRRATFSSLGESVFISVTSGSGVGTPEFFLELRDDVIRKVGWAGLPLLKVSWTGDSSSDFMSEGTGAGAYVFRVAWRLDDGSIGPASGPIISETPTGSTSYKPTFEVLRYNSPPGPAWDERAAGLVLIGHVPVTDDSGDVTTRALNAPGYVFEQLGESIGATVTFSGAEEDIIASKGYDGAGLAMHETQPGAVYTYNKRLLLGDVGRDLYEPDLRRILDWTEGTSDDGSDIHWVIFEVKIRTSSGIITRFSQPLPYQNSTGSPPAAQEVYTRYGSLFYRDDRAFRWRLLVSTDYTDGDDPATATWKELVVATLDTTFEDASGAFFAYRDARDQEPFDLTNLENTAVDASTLDFDSDGTDEWVKTSDGSTPTALESSVVLEGASGSDSDTHDAKLSISDALSGDLDTLYVKSDVKEEISGDDAGTTTASAAITVEVRDASDTVLATFNHKEPGSFDDKLSASSGDFTASNADHVRIYTVANVVLNSSGGDVTAEASAHATMIRLSTGTETAGEVIIDPTAANKEVDATPNLVTWSEPFQPLNQPAENLVFAGDENSDPVLALAAVGQEISTGQFGQYPIVCLSEESVRLLEVGTDPFIQAVTPVTGEIGIVGRRSFSITDGVVTAVTNRGVYRFTPQLQKPALSEPLHDVRDNFLNDVTGGDTAVGFYAERDRGRRELWIAGSNQTWVLSLKHGAWTQLSRQRRDFARTNNRLRGVDTSGQIQREFGDDTAQVSYTVVTGLEHFGKRGYMERLKTLLIQQRFMMEELRWKLCTKDPNASQALKSEPLNRATLPDGLTARDLLPNVLVESGTDSTDRGPLQRGDLGTIRLPNGLGYSWFARFEGTGEPDQGIEGWGAEFQKRRQVRAATFFPDQPQTITAKIEVEVPSGGGQAEIELFDQNGNDPDHVSAILWGDEDSTTSNFDVYHTYDSGGTYTIQIIGQPNLKTIYEVRLRGPGGSGGYNAQDLDLSDWEEVYDLNVLNFNGDPPSTLTNEGQEIIRIRFGGANYKFSYLPDSAREVELFDPTMQDDISNVPPNIEFFLFDGGVASPSTVQSGDFSSALYHFEQTSRDVTVNKSDLSSDAPGLQYYRHQWGYNGTLTGFLDTMNATPTLNYVRSKVDAEDLRGTGSNGPYITSELDKMILVPDGKCYVLDDWSQASSLAELQLRQGSAIYSGHWPNIDLSYSNLYSAIDGGTLSPESNFRLRHILSDSLVSSTPFVFPITYPTYNDLATLSNGPDFLWQRRTRPANLVSVDTSGDAVTVDDPNADLNIDESNWDRIRLCLLNSGNDDVYIVDHTDATSITHNSTNGETTINVDSSNDNIPSGTDASASDATAWLMFSNP